MYHSTDPRAALAATPVGTNPPRPISRAPSMRNSTRRRRPKIRMARAPGTPAARTSSSPIATPTRARCWAAPTNPTNMSCCCPIRGRAPRSCGATSEGRQRSLYQFRAGGRKLRHAAGAAKVVRMMTTRSEDLARRYAPMPRLTQSRIPICRRSSRGRRPAAGAKIRTYSLDVAATPGRFGRIFRCSTFMVNFLEPKNGPRDPSKMSPHHHDDFEQCSLALAGTFIHHLRWPWTTDMAEWRDDDHESCGSPSIAVIPPPSIHTSQADRSQAQRSRRHLLPAAPGFLGQAGLGAERGRLSDARATPAGKSAA